VALNWNGWALPTFHRLDLELVRHGGPGPQAPFFVSTLISLDLLT